MTERVAEKEWGYSFIKKNGLYVDPDHEWEIARYGFDTQSRWDIIYNTMRKIIDDKEYTLWSYRAYLICDSILFCGRRWPKSMDSLLDAKNRLRWWWSKLLHKLYIVKYQMYGPPFVLTRDPFIYTIAAGMILFDKEPVLTLPWYLYSPTTWAWKRYLETGKGGKWYLFLENLSSPKKDYVKNLKKYRKLAYEHKKIMCKWEELNGRDFNQPLDGPIKL